MKIPDKIYLQICEEHGVGCDEVTWCTDSINDTDVEYVLLERATQQKREPDNQDTTEAIVAEWATYAITDGNFKIEDAQKVTRFLRERLGRIK